MAEPHPSLELILRKAGCPYPAGSEESLVWIRGYKAGLDKFVAIGEAELLATLEPSVSVFQ